MFVFSSKMRRASDRIAPKLEVLQLRHCYLEGFKNSAQPGITRLRRAPSNLLKEIATIRIILMAYGAVWLPDKLRNDM